jgi:hypothetical protein
MQRFVSRIFALAVAAGLVATSFARDAAAADPAGTVDRALVGTWEGSGTILTSSMRKSGSFTVRIESNGQYILVLRAVDDFAIDWGPWTTTPGKFARNDSTGMEDQGTYRRIGDVFLFSSIFGTFELRAARDKQEAVFQRLGNLMRIAPTPAISDWTARAAAWAAMWQADAGLDQIEASGLSNDGTMTPHSDVSITFFSRAVGRFLLLSPSLSGAITSAIAPRGSRAPAPRPIPVPIADVSEMLRDARAGGFKGRYTSAVLKFQGDQPEQARPQWAAIVTGGGGFNRQCFDLATDRLSECGATAGDAGKDYDALAARAAAAWSWIQQQWAQGGAQSSTWSLESSELARCRASSGTYKAGACAGSDGARIFP